MAKCFACGIGPAQGVTVYRINEKGVPGIFGCLKHAKRTDNPPDAETLFIAGIIEEAGRAERGEHRSRKFVRRK